MAGKLMIVAAFLILGLVSAEPVTQPPGTIVEISGVYLEKTGFHLSFAWTGVSQPESVKLILNKDKSMFEYKPTKTEQKPSFAVDAFTVTYVCNIKKVNNKIGGCDVKANVTAEIADVNLKVEACWKDAKCISENINITFVEAVVTKNEVLLSCSSRGVPAPQFHWHTVINDVINEVNETSHSQIWNNEAKLWSSNSSIQLVPKEKMIVKCCSKLGSDQNSDCKDFTINSSGKISTPGIFVVLLLVHAYVSKRMV